MQVKSRRLIQDIRPNRRIASLPRNQVLTDRSKFETRAFTEQFTKQPEQAQPPALPTTPDQEGDPVSPPKGLDINNKLLHSGPLARTPRPFETVPIKGRRAQKKAKKNTNPHKQSSIMEHVAELRQRLLWCTMALVFGGFVGYRYQEEIIAWLVRPLNQKLFYTSPTGGFDFLIKICIFVGFLLALPIIMYNLIRFISPAIPKNVSHKIIRLVSISVMLAASGVAFAYYISMPAALHFLSGFNNNQVASLISAQEYLNFAMIYMVAFALLFQLPLLVVLINKVTPLAPKMLMKKQRIVILVSFIVAAILTPTPDPANQTLMALPIIALYQTSIGAVWHANKRTAKHKQRTDAETLPELLPV